MQIRKLSKEELGEKVLFPRTQLQGVSCTGPDIALPQLQDFNLERVELPNGRGTAQMIVEQQEPQMAFQLFDGLSEEEFDNHLGTLLGMHDLPSYIAGRTDFMVLFQGARGVIEVTQQNHREVYQRICKTQEQAARWWHLYGKH